MAHIQLKLNGAAVDDWLAILSTELPNAEFKVLSAILTDAGLLGITEITTTDGDRVLREFADAPGVRSHEVLHMDAQLILIQFRGPVSESHEALLQSKTLPQYPVSLQKGWFFAELTASHEKLSKYIHKLTAAGIPYQIESVTQSHDSSELLTDRQWEFITAAVERGFYDTPRDCTLTDVAEPFDITTSAASRLLHRAESRIITAFVTEAGP